MRLYLREDFKADLESAHAGAGADLLAALDALGGAPARLARGRRTLRFTLAGKAYFVKRHDGVGFAEIAKNLLAFKAPVLGAGNEFAACARLREHGVPAPGVAAFAESGRNPARRRSAVVLDALEGRVSLEAPSAAATPVPRRHLIDAAAATVRAMHDAGVYHRDCYAAHLLLDLAACASARPGRPGALAIIDLHRARLRRRLPTRWRRRDLAALLFSADAWRLTGREKLRFAIRYGRAGGGRGDPNRRRAARFWRSVRRRAERLRRRSARRGRCAFAPAPAAEDHPPPSVTDFHTLRRPPPLPFRFDIDLPSGPRRAVCDALPRWRRGRGFVAEAICNGERGLLVVSCGLGGAWRLRRAERHFKRLASASGQAPALEPGRSGSARVLLLGDAGRPVSVADVEAAVEALAHVHECGLRPAGAADTGYRVGPDGAWFVAEQARRRVFVGRCAAERDLAALLACLGTDRPVADLLRRYEQARSWRSGRLRLARVSRLGATAGAAPLRS